MLNRSYDYDLVILGGGSAGIVAAAEAGAAGLRTLLIEKGRMGGESMNAGAAATRTLLHAAQVAHQMRTADHLGLRPVSLTRADAADVLRHVRSTMAREEESEGPTDLLRKHGVEIRIGDPRFISPDALELSEREGPTRLISAEHFLLATGSAPARPAVGALEEISYITNHDVYELQEVPESLTVIGAGSVAVEMAQAFARLGSRVTLLAKGPRLLPHDDFEAANLLADALRNEGVDIRLNAEVVGARAEEESGTRKIVRIGSDGAQAEVSSREILIAAGRTPNVEGLGLEAARVEFTAGGVKVNPKLHTSGPRIWACGDVIGRYQFTWMAEFESKLVVHNILFPFQPKTDPGFKLAPWVTFTDPEVARVGLTEEEAQKQTIQYQVYRQEFGEGEGQSGVVKVLATGWQGKILGAHIVGPRAGDLIHEWITAISRGQTMRQVADTIHVYPTLSRANQDAATQWYEAQSENPLVRRSVETYVRTVRPNLGRIALGLVGLGLLAGGALALRTLRNREE
jgi:pyruvate/2-oxoglutarate dehydrogenase complex dihydrolipoamide dehydrogenase (E3) component